MYQVCSREMHHFILFTDKGIQATVLITIVSLVCEFVVILQAKVCYCGYFGYCVNALAILKGKLCCYKRQCLALRVTLFILTNHSDGRCGISKYPDVGRNLGFIVGGTSARANEFPWQVGSSTQ